MKDLTEEMTSDEKIAFHENSLFYDNDWLKTMERLRDGLVACGFTSEQAFILLEKRVGGK